MLALATKGSQLIQETNQLLNNLRHYLPKDDLRLHRLMAEADKLMNANPQEAHNVKGMVYQLSGDFEQSLYHMENAVRLGPGNPVALPNKCSILINFGFFSEAAKLYREIGSPRKGAYPLAIRLGLGTGGFLTMASFIEQARKLKLDLASVEALAVENAAQLMSRYSLSDENLAAYLDVAGEIMREERVVFCDMPEIFAWNSADDPVLSVTYEIPVDAYRAEELDCELASRLIERFSEIPWFLSVTFASGLADSDERYPARASAVSV